MVDSTDKERIQEVRTTLESLIRDDVIEGLPVLMLANKQDVKGAYTILEIQEIFNSIAVALEARDSKALGVCALTGFEILI